MQSQGSGANSVPAAKGMDVSNVRHLGVIAFARSVVTWLFVCLLFFVGIAHATSYVYDANGRVVAVTQSNGVTARYTYDALGNRLQVSTVPAGQLAVFAFNPTHGVAGTTVTLLGQGFSTTLANDSVSFNGTHASIVSATATQLVTTVPVGAATGLIAVTVSGMTANSPAPFVIDDTGVPPTITQVSPTVVAVGDPVTVSGAHLYPLPNQTTVQLGGRDVSLSSATDAQLQFAVSDTSTSGYVVAQTPYGQATSLSPIFVVPSGVSTASVVSTGVATVNGTSVPLNIGAAGQIGAVMFNASSGNWMSLQASNVTTTASNITYRIYAPGNVLIQSGTVSAASPSIHLPQLAQSGMYVATFQPDTAGAQLSVAVQTNATLTSGTVTTVISSVPGQSQRVLFAATAGQTLAFTVVGTTTSPAGATVGYTVYTPNGAVYTSTSTASTGVINLANLPTTGTYQVVVAPPAGVTGSMQVQIAPGVTGTVPTNGTSGSYSAKAAGENIYLSFTATQGQNLELTLNNINVTGGSNNAFYVNIYNVSGTNIASYYCYGTNPGSSCMQHLWNMPAGTYSIIASPNWGGTINFNALIKAHVVGTTIASGGTAAINLSAGQAERLTFSGILGSTIALNVTGVTTTPTGNGVRFIVYRPDAGTINTSTAAYTDFDTASGQLVNLPNLPVSGTYTVIVLPDYGLPATATIGLVAGSTGTVPTNGTSGSYSAKAAGENIYLSFTATQGQNLELTLNNINVTGGSNNAFYVNIYNVSGTNIASYYCYGTNPGSSCMQHLWNMPAGTYSIIASPNWGGTINFNALIKAHVVGTTIASGGTAAINLSAGQAERLTFSGILGSTIALNVTGVTTTPTGNGVRFIVYRPDAGTINTSTAAYTDFDTASGQLVNLPNLPVSGTYTVIVLPDYGLPATATIGLVAGSTGTVPTNGTSGSYSAKAAGENIYLSFTATQGQNLELTLNNINVTGGSNNAFYVNIYNVSGTNIASYYCYGTNPGSSCMQHLWNMPAGTYSIIASPNWGGTINFNALLSNDIAGPAIATGGAAAVNLGAGQVERLTFSGNVGDTVTLNVSGVTTTPTGNGVRFIVYRPDAGTINAGTAAHSDFDTGSGQNVSLSNLPVNGTYTVIVAPDYGLPTTTNLSVSSDTAGPPVVYGSPTLPTTGVPQSQTASGPGQTVTMTFNATQSQNLELTLSNVVAASGNWVNVTVNTGSGVNISNAYCYPSTTDSCRIALWNLAAGTYSVVVSPYPYASPLDTISFSAQIQADVVGPALTANTPATVNLAAGQLERMTFNANLGDSIVLALSNVSTTPAGQAMGVNVYRPDGGQITPTNYYTNLSTGGSTMVNLPNLPAGGTYTLVFYTGSGVPATGQIAEYTSATGTPTALVPTNNTVESYAAKTAGQNVYLTFNATQGQNLELTLSNVVAASGNWVNVTVNTGSGVNISNAYCYPSTTDSCRIALWNLAAGTYSVVVSPYPYASPLDTISFSAQIQADVVGPALTANTPATVNLAAGQLERMTFNANLGDSIVLALSNVSTTPAGQAMGVNVYRPDGGQITPTNYYTNLSTGGSTMVNLPNLPAGGTYTLVFYTGSGVPATAQIAEYTSATGTPTALVPTNNTVESYAAKTAGQNVYLTFNATQGQNLELTLSNVVAASGNWVNVTVNTGSGVNISNAYCYPSTTDSCRIALWNLAAGTYSVVVSPYPYASPLDTISFSAQIQADVVGPALTANTPATVNLAAGQLERMTFNANLGDSIVLALSNVSTTPAGQVMGVNVYRPDGGQITPTNYYTNLSTGGSTMVNLPNLPAGGTYTLVFYTGSGVPATAQVMVSQASNGILPTTGSAKNFMASGAGQNVNLGFTATAGQNLELTLNNAGAAGGSTNGFEVHVYNPAGGSVATYDCYAANPGGSCMQSLWNLTAGTYSVVAIPIFGGTISFTAQLKLDVSGPTLAANTAATVSLAAGQIERLKFSGTSGQAVSLQLSGITTTPAGQSLSISVYRPDVGTITTTDAYAQTSAASPTSLSLPNLPLSGTYTVVVNSPYGLPTSTQLTLVPQ